MHSQRCEQIIPRSRLAQEVQEGLPGIPELILKDEEKVARGIRSALQAEGTAGAKTWGHAMRGVHGCGDKAGKEKSGQGTWTLFIAVENHWKGFSREEMWLHLCSRYIFKGRLSGESGGYGGPHICSSLPRESSYTAFLQW